MEKINIINELEDFKSKVKDLDIKSYILLALTKEGHATLNIKSSILTFLKLLLCFMEDNKTKSEKIYFIESIRKFLDEVEKGIYND